MKTFKDLEHKEHPNRPDWTQARMFFENGYWVSVIKSRSSYGGEEWLYELAVLEWKEGDARLTYETTVTDDVVWYCTPEKITELMEQVQLLIPNE